MALLMTAPGAKHLSDGIWELDIPPHQIERFGSPATRKGSHSVVLLEDCEWLPSENTLSFGLDQVVPLNIGSGSKVVAVKASTTADHLPDGQQAAGSVGRGDREFIAMCERLLPVPMQRASKQLLEGVRRRSPGDLKRGKSRNFSDTPDNFWYVIVQPRVAQLSITVRGPVSHFAPIAKLPIKDDRGNTLFKVTSEGDIPEALRLIFHARRK